MCGDSDAYCRREAGKLHDCGEEAAQRIFAAEEWVASQDWTGKEEPCAVQVALEKIRKDKANK
jgi:hypothetical protein